MKKILIALIIGLFSVCFAEDFTWAYYELLCAKYNVEPSYETYIYLVENPQCFELPELDQ